MDVFPVRFGFGVAAVSCLYYIRAGWSAALVGFVWVGCGR